MTQLQEAVAQVFAPQGGLALAEPAFTPRPGQTRMALAVAGAIEEGQVLVVEAARFQPADVPLNDCTLPRLVPARKPDARIKRSGKRAGQVVRLNHHTTNSK